VFIWVGLLLSLNWFSVAFLDPDPPGSSFVLLGNFLGSLFAQTTLASAWAALGAGPMIWRVPLSFVWVISLIAAIAINVAFHGGPSGVIVPLGSCLLGQWVLLQLPFWALALIMRLRVRRIEEVQQEFDVSRFQFGIRHLLIVMAVASAVLGIGRIVVLNLSAVGEEVVFVFLAGAAIVLTLPLLLAALMRRMAIPGVLLALVLIGVATAWELPLWEKVGEAGPEIGHFVAINAASAIVILVAAGLVRLNGYFLCAQPAARKTSTD
jgi:hypothetical protein